MKITSLFDHLLSEELTHGARNVKDTVRAYLKRKVCAGEFTIERRKPLNPAQRRYIYDRQDGCCRRCGDSFPSKELTDDHIIPLSRGGTNELRNRQLLCAKCNAAKSNGTPITESKKTGTTVLEQLQ